MAQSLIIGISGASGAVYGITALRALKEAGVDTHLVLTQTAHITIPLETGMKVAEVEKLATHVHSAKDLAACISSGSYPVDGMLVAPCSMRSLAEIATGLTSNLLTRSADVVLKERKRLVLLTRETPLNASHIRNMLAVTEMGGIIAPPVPAFYAKPDSLQDMVNHSIGRALDLFAIPHELVRRWKA